MSYFVGEEDILALEEIGVSRPGRVDVTPYARSMPGRYGDDYDIQGHTRAYPDVWDYKGQWNEVGAEGEHCKICKIRSFAKDGKVITVACCETKSGAKLMIATAAPLPAGESAELGWSPWGSIKKAAKSLGKTAKRGVKGIAKVVKSPAFQKYAAMAAAPAWYASYKALQNPQIRKFAMQVAPMAGAAFGIPPQYTAMATGVLQNALQGNQQALGKVRNISQLASQGYGPAVQLRNTMSMLYRGGMQQWGQGMPLPQQPQVPQMPQFRVPRMPWQQSGMPQLPYGLSRFNVPTPGWGQGYVSGWLYNVPVRNVLQAALESPALKVRSLYNQGMVGAAKPGRVNVVPYARSMPGRYGDD